MRPLPEGIPLLPDPDIKHATGRLTDTTLRVIHPIFPASSYHPLAGGEENAGWLEVEIDRSNLVIAKYRSLLYTVLLLILALAVSGAVAIRFANGIGRVVEGINNALTEMGNGDLEVRLKEDAYGELRALQSALNQLGSSILEGQQELQQNVDQATEDLRETLETIEIQNIERSVVQGRQNETNIPPGIRHPKELAAVTSA